jgi:hypothetical protein
MTPEGKRRFEQRLGDLSIADLEVEKQKWIRDSEERATVESILAKKRAAERAEADAEAQQRFAKTYDQKERHHRDVKRSAWIAAIVSLLGAGASWASFWFQTYHSQPTAAPASPAPAVATPSPTQAPLTSPTPAPADTTNRNEDEPSSGSLLAQR